MRSDAMSNPNLLELSAFPASLEEEPWHKEVVATLAAGNNAHHIQVAWQHGHIDLDGLGYIEVRPTILAIEIEWVEHRSALTLTVSDGDQQQLGIGTTGQLITTSVPIASRNECYLHIETANSSGQEGVSYRLQVQGSAFIAILALRSRNLWLVVAPDEGRAWKDDEVDYPDPHLLIEDLATYLDRFVAEANVVGYRERQMKKAAILFALGRVAQMVGLYRDAATFYGKSANMFHGQRNPAKEIEALRSVRDLYKQQGLKEQTKIITVRLLRLESKKLCNEQGEE
jgi:hypothetical protein